MHQQIWLHPVRQMARKAATIALMVQLSGCVATTTRLAPRAMDRDVPPEPIVLNLEGRHARFSELEAPSKIPVLPGRVQSTVQGIDRSSNTGSFVLTTQTVNQCVTAEIIPREEVTIIKRRPNSNGNLAGLVGGVAMVAGLGWSLYGITHYAIRPPESPVASPNENRSNVTLDFIFPLTLLGGGAAVFGTWAGLSYGGFDGRDSVKLHPRLRHTGQTTACANQGVNLEVTARAGTYPDKSKQQLISFGGKRVELHAKFAQQGIASMAFADPTVGWLFAAPSVCMQFPDLPYTVQWRENHAAMTTTDSDQTLCVNWNRYKATAALVHNARIAIVKKFAKTKILGSVKELILALQGKGAMHSTLREDRQSRPIAEASDVVAALVNYAEKAYPKAKIPADNGFAGEGVVRLLTWRAAQHANNPKAAAQFLKAFPTAQRAFHAQADDLLWQHSKKSSSGVKTYRSLLPHGKHHTQVANALATAYIKEKKLENYLVECRNHPKWKTIRGKYLASKKKVIGRYLRTKDFSDAYSVLRKMKKVLVDDKGVSALERAVDKAEEREADRIAKAEAREEAYIQRLDSKGLCKDGMVSYCCPSRSALIRFVRTLFAIFAKYGRESVDVDTFEIVLKKFNCFAIE